MHAVGPLALQALCFFEVTLHSEAQKTRGGSFAQEHQSDPSPSAVRVMLIQFLHFGGSKLHNWIKKKKKQELFFVRKR